MEAVVATRLVTQNIGDISQAGYRIGENRYDNYGFRVAPLVLVPDRNRCKPWIVVPKGFTAIVTSHDRYVGIWTAGRHTCAPWVRISHLIPQQFIVYDTPVKECPTQDNVMVEIDVTLIFHIKTDEKDLLEFAYKLGPEKLDKMLKAFQEEAVREMARKRKYNEIYDLMDTAGDKQLEVTVRTMNNSLNVYGVEVERITITNVHLPPDLRDTMQEATTWQSKNTYNAIEQDYELLKIDNHEFQKKREQKVSEERHETQAEYDKREETATAKVESVKADARKMLAEIKEDTNSRVRDIDSKNNLEVAEIDAQKKVLSAQIQAAGDAKVASIQTDAAAYVLTKRAEARLIVARNEALALEYNAEAEKIAAVRLKQKREFDEKIRHLQALKKMCTNKNVVVSGNNGDNAVAQMLSAKQGAVALGLQ